MESVSKTVVFDTIRTERGDNMNKYIRTATRSINTSLPIEISEAQLESILQSGETDNKWTAHVKIFLQEAPIELIHNLVISGATSFKKLDVLYFNLAKSSNTWRWVHEMAK